MSINREAVATFLGFNAAVARAEAEGKLTPADAIDIIGNWAEINKALFAGKTLENLPGTQPHLLWNLDEQNPIVQMAQGVLDATYAQKSEQELN